MAELSLMASAAFSPGSFRQDPGLCRPPWKEFKVRLPGHDRRQEMLKSGSMQLSIQYFDHSWKSLSLLSDYHKTAWPAPALSVQKLIDVQDIRPDSVLFSFGIAEQFIRHEKIMKFLMSASNIEGEGLDISVLTGLMGLCTVDADMPHVLGDDTFGHFENAMDDTRHFMGLHTVTLQPHVLRDNSLDLYKSGMDDPQYFMHSDSQFFSSKSFLEFVNSHSSMIMVHPDGQVLFTGSQAEMRDLLSLVADSYPSRRWSNGSRQMIVPYFNWSGGARRRASTKGYSSKLQTRTASHLNSLENVQPKPHPKKKQNRKAENQRDLFRKNYFHACEILLYAVLNTKRDRMATLSLTKSGPEVTQLLTEFSTGIAGTGLAVLFIVISSTPIGKVPFSAAKLLSTGFGFGLFWLSWAVNSLRDTIKHTSKNSSQLKLREEEIVENIERSVNEILFRAAALIIVALLRFA